MMPFTLFIAMALIAAVNCLGPIRARTTVLRVERGMVKDEVRRILGMPNGQQLNESWSYERFMNPGWLVVHFDSNGCVQYVDHEIPFP